MGGTGVCHHSEPTYYVSARPPAVMDIPFQLKFSVEQRHLPDEVEELTTYSVNATLQHTVYHIKELIWIHSPNYSLKPVFVKITYNDADLNDLDSLGQILGLQEAPEVSTDGWKLVIDYTLFNSPFIPSKDPVHSFFDIQIKGNAMGRRINTLTRKFLGTNVSEIKTEIAERYSLQEDKFELKFKGDTVNPTDSLRNILSLDVPSLHAVEFSLVSTPLVIKLVLHSILDGNTFAIELEELSTFDSLKSSISQQTGDFAPLIALYNEAQIASAGLLAPDKRLLVDYFGPDILGDEQSLHLRFEIVKLKEIVLDGQQWHRTGQSFVELEGRDGATRLVKDSDVGSEYYTIELDGSTLKFSTSELIANESEGYVLVNPSAYARIEKEWPWVEGNTQNSENLSSRNSQSLSTANITNVHGDTLGITSMNSSTIAAGIHTVGSSDSGIVNERNANESPENNAGRNVNARNIGVNNVDSQANNIVEQLQVNIQNDQEQAELPNAPAAPQGNQAVIERIQRVVAANAQNIMQMAIHAVIVVVVFGIDVFRAFMKPEILAFIIVAGTFSTFFFWGCTISDWIDRSILQDAPLNQLDFQIIHRLSRFFRFCNNITIAIHTMLVNLITSILPSLFRPRHEWLANEINGNNNILRNIGDSFKELVGNVVMFCATLLPSLQEGIEQYWLAERNAESEKIWVEIRKLLDEPTLLHRALFKRAVEHKFGQAIDDFAERSDGNDMESLLKLFVMIVKMKTVFFQENDQIQGGKAFENSTFVELGDIGINVSEDVESDNAVHIVRGPDTELEILVRNREGATGAEIHDTETLINQR